MGVLGVGIYFFLKNESHEDYFVGGRSISSFHIGLSIVATDVGGGFSIGLGGLGFVMGISGSWLLFTGLVGAWLAAIFTVPKLKKLDMESGYMTYPDFLKAKYGERVAIFAALISGIGYLGFTGCVGCIDGIHRQTVCRHCVFGHDCLCSYVIFTFCDRGGDSAIHGTRWNQSRYLHRYDSMDRVAGWAYVFGVSFCDL